MKTLMGHGATVIEITHVAMIWEGKLYSLPKPNRHHNLIQMAFAETGHPVYQSWQGFLDSNGKFVGRKEAYKTALKACQLDIMRPKTCPLHLLFSEDIW